MYADTLKSRGTSTIVVAALALLLASCTPKQTTPTEQIGGTVSGLIGTGLVLQNNGGDNLSISGNGAFTFANGVKKDSTYRVTVFVQPTGQTCTVANGSGTATANVTNVAVTCAGGFTVGGTVSGLTGTGLVLRNNGGNNLTVSANGGFTFSAPVAGAYNVTVFTQPSGQNCTVTNGSGTATANVTNVAVACASTTFTVGGTVSGLTGTGLVLQNNGGNNLSAGNGVFTFSTSLVNGAAYNVTVLTQPTGQACAVANGNGIVAGANVTNVAVTCAAPPAAPSLNPLGFGVKELRFSWTAPSGATFYRLLENPDGVSGYNQVATDIFATSFNLTIPVHRRLNASYIVEACNAVGCADSAPRVLGTDLVNAIGYAKASNTDAGDAFGYALAVSGDGNTLAVGAKLEGSSTTTINSTPDNLAPGAGAVYVYARGPSGWSQQAYVKASNAEAQDGFGWAVALSGDGSTLAVGAPMESSALTGVNVGLVTEALTGNDAPQAGAVYVFTRSGTTWTQKAYVKPTNTAASDFFGSSVALSDDGQTLAVGAIGESTANLFAGAVYVYARNLDGWLPEAFVTASVPGFDDEFGTAVALSANGNTLAVGSPNDSTGDAGAAYVYTRSAGIWSEQARVLASNAGDSDHFGMSVALSGDGNTLAVGAPFEDGGATGVGGTPDEGSLDSGAAYVYTRSAGVWSEQAYVKASNTGGGDHFGWSVALSGDGNSLAVGAPLEDGSATGIGGGSNEGAIDAGAVYSYSLSAGTWSQQAYVKASNTGVGDNFGWMVSLSSDGNALAVGALMEDGGSNGIGSTQTDNTKSNSGAAYLY